MTPRLLAASLAIAATLGLAHAPRSASAQAPDAKAQAPKAVDDKPKADDPAKDMAKDADKDKDKPAKPPRSERATFGGGCFWCTEAVFERIPGVKSVVSGYAGGNVPNPTYEMVSSGLTGHAEVIQVEFDPDKVGFDKLLKLFWASHDPTTLNAQGPDHGTQYRSIILVENEDQRKAALKSIQEVVASRKFRAPITTEVVPLNNNFYPAEAYHQDYYRNHKYADYSQIYIAPKLRKLQSGH